MNGTIIHQVMNLAQFQELLPTDAASLMNNHPAIRMVIEQTTYNSWDRIKEIVCTSFDHLF